jgi:mono/diheme cytochrome c family protein
MRKNILFSVLTISMVSLFLVSFTVSQPQQPKPWPVPAEYKNMKNPVKADAESLALGKSLYTKNCASCHGKTGLGDGPKGRTLETFSGDFSGAFYQNQTDGEHFYKTKYGRDEMPAYDKKISDEDMWHMVNYMRTFKK